MVKVWSLTITGGGGQPEPYPYCKTPLFLPTPASVAAWVFRWQVSPLPPLPHLQSFVSLRYRTFLLGTENAVGGGRGSLAVYAILFKTLYISSIILNL